MAKKLNMVVLLSVFIFFFCIETVFGFKALDGSIEINGFYKNDSAVRLSDGQSDLHGEELMVWQELQKGGRQVIIIYAEILFRLRLPGIFKKI